MPKRLDFRKNTKRPLAPPPTFLEDYITFFSQIHAQKALF